MNWKDSNFRDRNGAIEVRFRELSESGVGAQVSHTPIVSVEKKTILWASKVIGGHNPIGLQRAVFFYVRKALCLRGGEQERILKHSQFQCSFSPHCYAYIENGSKNYSGVNSGENKVVVIYAVTNANP